MEGGGRGQTARAFHELRVGAVPELGRELPHIMMEDRRKIGVGEGGVAAADQLDERADVVAGRDLGEPDFGGDFGEARLVRGIAIAVHQHDRDARQPPVARGLQRGACLVLVEGGQDRAVGAGAFGDLGDGGVGRRRAVEPAREKLGPVLIADGERIAETPRDREQGRLPLAFEQRVGRDGAAHADRERRQRAAARAGEVADRIDRRVAGAGGVFAEIFGGDDRALGGPRDDIGEGAAAVDPDMPARISCRHGDQASG